jgi:omega-amidase
MKIALIQPEIIWEDKEKNFLAVDEAINRLINPDLVVLPEMFSTGFSMNVEKLAEPAQGKTMKWLKDKAQSHNCCISASFIVKENASYYNRFVFVFADGSAEHYDKRHLFRMGEENIFFEKGKKRVIIEHTGWKIFPQVCYDLRFPVWSRNKNEYDLIINVANWPEIRKDHWEILLRARAVENSCYVAGVNRTGRDANGISYSGESMVISPNGKIIAAAGNEPVIIETELSMELLKNYREKFPVHLDMDNFNLYL